MRPTPCRGCHGGFPPWASSTGFDLSRKKTAQMPSDTTDRCSLCERELPLELGACEGCRAVLMRLNDRPRVESQRVPLLRAHSVAARRRLPVGWHGKLRGRLAEESLLVRVMAAEAVAARPKPAKVAITHGYRPLSTQALCEARPLLDAMGDAVHPRRDALGHGQGDHGAPAS